MKTQNMKNVLVIVVLFAITTTIFVAEYRPFLAPLIVPISYSGDALFAGFGIKTVLDNGWWTFNRYTGGTTGTVMYDFPNADILFYAIIKCLSLFTRDYGLVMNILYYLGFLLTSVVSFYVAKRYGVSELIAIAVSLLYAFLPYHIMRGEWHLFLSEYFIVPLVTMVFLDILLGKDYTKSKLLKSDPTLRKDKLLAFLIMIMVGSSGIYYAFFACSLFLLIFVILLAETKKVHFVPLVFVGIICLTIMINNLPSFIYSHINGANAYVGKRLPMEAEVYGLKIYLMIFPTHKSHFSPLSFFAPKISDFILNENADAYLGIWGVAGLLILLLYIFIRGKNRLLIALSKLNIFAIILGTIGGAGAIFAITVSPNIRAYNRISIFIGYFALLAFAERLSTIAARIKSRQLKLLMSAAILILLSAGIIDQYGASKHRIPDRRAIYCDYENDDDFVRDIESRLKPEDLVFQLPYMPFPENGPISKMDDYDQFKGYLHSTKIRWSYGIMKGRVGDQWLSNVSNLDLQNMVDQLATHGYKGIYLDRSGYEDRAESLEGQLKAILIESGMESKDNRHVYYDLQNYASLHGLDMVPDDGKEFIGLYWENGFSTIESTKSEKWIWCNKTGDLVIMNASKDSIKMKVSMGLASGHNEVANLSVSGLIKASLRINQVPLVFSRSVNVPPGRNTIHFETDAKKVVAPNDPRSLYFRVFDPVIE